MAIPAGRIYSQTLQWARAASAGAITVGIARHALELLGALVFVDSPAIGRKRKIVEQCCVAESVKSVSEIYAPVSGEVPAVNGELDTAPEKINQDAYQAWIFKLKPADDSQLASMLDAERYQKLIEAQAHWGHDQMQSRFDSVAAVLARAGGEPD